MAQDIIQYIDKITNATITLGEIQVGDNGFNQSFALDGTKDSFKCVVKGYADFSLTPNTIVYHQRTNTWWIVDNDKVTYYMNESGGFYMHELQLVGAIELLNARDLTDSGFNNNRYTVDSFIKRLFSLSTFEYQVIIEYHNLIDSSMNVDYVKTFENYTLLSALREFLDGYNLSCRLSFATNNNIVIATLDIICKTGDTNSDPLDIDDFDDTRIVRTINKNSFGTTVVSNAENVISTKSKVYPILGGVSFSADDYLITPQNACIRLPSKVHSVEWVKMFNTKTKVGIGRTQGSDYQNAVLVGETEFITLSRTSFEDVFDWIYQTLYNDIYPRTYLESLPDDFWTSAKNGYETFINNIGMTFRNGVEYDPISKNFQSDFTRYVFKNYATQLKEYNLGNKSLRQGVDDENQVMYWEQGSNLIKGFDFFQWWAIGTGIKALTIETTNLQGIYFIRFSVTYSGITYHYNVVFGSYAPNGNLNGYIEPSNYKYDMQNVTFQIKYTPMSDIKVKLDNEIQGKDIQLYNQNGKITDSVALSKLLLSYSKEIQSDNITRYMTYYYSTGIPQVGRMVKKGNDMYVINHISKTFYQNEGSDYFVDCQFTLSKKIATKSLMVNPNTNIRDYGIPQTNNVVRKQLYRDFYELSWTTDTNADNDYYMPLRKVVKFPNLPQTYPGHKALIKVTFADNNSYYYQLDTTTYILKKSLYEIVDFQDNNIIGYDFQNKWSGFDITRVLGNQYDSINTPISYVDSNGEVKGISVALMDTENINIIYDTICEGQPDAQNSYKLYQRVFAEYSMWHLIDTYEPDVLIEEPNYKKDALEVPFFEYSAQIDDSDDIEIGENIIENADDETLGYIYSYKLVNKNRVNSLNALSYANTPTVSSNVVSVSDAAYLEVSLSNQVYISGYSTISFNKSNKEITLSESDRVDLSTINKTKDICIYLHTIKANSIKTDLVMILRNVSNATINNNRFVAIANHYKVK